MSIVRLVNPTYDVRRRRVVSGNITSGGERGEFMARRRRNPFGAGGMNVLAVKVGGGLVGGIAAATVPGMLGASMSSGWPGVAAALAVAFGLSYVSRSSS